MEGIALCVCVRTCILDSFLCMCAHSSVHVCVYVFVYVHTLVHILYICRCHLCTGYVGACVWMHSMHLNGGALRTCMHACVLAPAWYQAEAVMNGAWGYCGWENRRWQIINNHLSLPPLPSLTDCWVQAIGSEEQRKATHSCTRP